jgi:hypothetical protein
MVFNVSQSTIPSNIFYPAPAGANGSFNSNFLSNNTAMMGAVTASKGIISAWIKPNQDNAFLGIFTAQTSSGSDGFTLSRDNNKFYFSTWKNSFAISYQLETANTYPITSYPKFVNVIVAWNTNFSSGNKLGNIIVNGVNDTVVTSDAFGAWSLDYTSVNRWRAFNVPNTIVSTPGSGALSQIYCYPNQYLALTNLANCRKFISGTNRPQFLGLNGAAPLSSQPLVFLNGVGAAFNVNSGSGGNFTTTGTLTTPSTTPSAP